MIIVAPIPKCFNINIAVICSNTYLDLAETAARRHSVSVASPVACVLHKFTLRSTTTENESAMRSALVASGLDKGSFGGGRTLVTYAA